MSRWTPPPGADPILDAFIRDRIEDSPIGRVDIEFLLADFFSWLTYSGVMDLNTAAARDWLSIDRRRFSAWIRHSLKGRATKQLSQGRYYLQGVALREPGARRKFEISAKTVNAIWQDENR